jgi:hypothetical protein
MVTDFSKLRMVTDLFPDESKRSENQEVNSNPYFKITTILMAESSFCS